MSDDEHVIVEVFDEDPEVYQEGYRDIEQDSYQEQIKHISTEDETAFEDAVAECYDELKEYAHNAIIPLCENMTFNDLYDFVQSS